MTGALESTAAGREDDLAVLERIPLEDRGGPASTYEALVRAAEQWPERPAISCLPDADHWERPSTRTFAELAGDVHRLGSVYAGFGVRRRDAVAILSVNCGELIAALLAAEAVGVAAPINPALAAGPAAELVRRPQHRPAGHRSSARSRSRGSVVSLEKRALARRSVFRQPAA